MDDILAAKKQTLQQRKAKTPIEAIRALASMQKRPLPILNTVTEGEGVTLVGQICHSDTLYDPVALALRYMREGFDAVNLFTDDSVYTGGLGDLALVARAVRSPVICQDYVLDEYQVVEMRAAGASALILDSSLVDARTLRTLVSATQRNRMTAVVQVVNADQLEYALSLSPHVIALNCAKAELPCYLRKLIPRGMRMLATYVLETMEDVRAVAALCPDAALVGERLIGAVDEIQRCFAEARRLS